MGKSYNSRKRMRSVSTELKLNKKYKETQDSTSDISISSTEEESEYTTQDESVTKDSNKSKMADLDLNILKTPEAMNELIKIFEPLLKSIEERLSTKIDNLEKNIDERLKSVEIKQNELEVKTRQDNTYAIECTEKLDQRSRTNNLLFCGIPEANGENLEKEILDFVNDKLTNVSLKPQDIDKCFRIKTDTKKKLDKNPMDKTPRPILVRFENYKSKKEIYKAKNQLRDMNKHYYINEDLTPTKSALFAKARTLRNDNFIWKTWTHDSIIYYTFNEKDDKPKTISTEDDINHIRKTTEPRPVNNDTDEQSPSTSKA